MEDLFILGTGGHAFEVADVAEASGYRPIFVTRDRADIDNWAHDVEIVDEARAFAGPQRNFAIGIGDNRLRSKVAARVGAQGRFPVLIHPDTSLNRETRSVAMASAGTVIMAGARFTNNEAIGDFVTVNLNVTVSHDVEIGDFANLAPGANIAGNVRIGEGAWLGVGVAINHGQPMRKLVIGAWTVIGSGAVVIADCDPGATYVGVPARKI